MIGIHDNTANNRRNPDPTMWAGFGERSVDDMLQVWINIVYLDDAEYQAPGRRAREDRRQDDDAATTATAAVSRRHRIGRRRQGAER